MKYIVLGIFVALAIVVALLVFTRKAEATVIKWSECVSTGIQCGTDNGTQYRDIREYADPICPKWYHAQNSGNWNQRCHRDYHWLQPEHKAPIGCPSGYSQDGSSCVKVTKEVRTCQTGVIQYDGCKPEGTCPTECGYPGGEVADGKGGDKTCAATVACEVDVCDNLDGMQTEIPDGYYQEENNCYEKEEPKPEPKPERPKFAEDTRCFDIAVPDVTWFDVATGVPEDNKLDLSWSAEMGDKVEIKFSEDSEDLRWTIITENDGHEQVGNLTNGTHYWFKLRTINSDCAKSNWTELVDPLP